MSDPIVGSVADEGEGQGNDLPPVPTGDPAHSPEREPFNRRVANAWKILRGKSITQRITTDPEAQIRQRRLSSENRWRNIYAFALLTAMLWQIGNANVFFGHYARENDYDLDPSVIVAFLSAVVVEVIGLVLVVTRSLFPRDKNPPSVQSPPGG